MLTRSEPIAALALISLAACFAPPALIPSGEKTIGFEALEFPPHAQLAEVALPSGEKLRGVFCPADPGAPVVLHLLESSGSVSSRSFPVQRVLWDYADLGCASLMLDYRGIGPSDGERSTRHIPEDVQAMWDEALRRAGGDPRRVIVRGTSIGTLAACVLHANDVHPAAWVLIVPVRGETVVRNFARRQYGRLVADIATSVFEPVVDVDLVHELANMREPLWVMSCTDDFMLPAAEKERVARAVAASAGCWQLSNWGHEMTALGAHGMLKPDESRFVRTLFPNWPDGHVRAADVLAALPPSVAATIPEGSEARRRLDRLASRVLYADPLLVAALAREIDDVEAAEDLIAHERFHFYQTRGRLEGLEFEALCRVFDFDDPAGDIEVSQYIVWGCIDWLRDWLGRDSKGLDVDGLLALAEQSEKHYRTNVEEMHTYVNDHGGSQGTHMNCINTWKHLLEDRGLTLADARRHFMRILLKNATLEDRVTQAADGSCQLEAFERGEWRSVDLDWPSPAR